MLVTSKNNIVNKTMVEFVPINAIYKGETYQATNTS